MTMKSQDTASALAVLAGCAPVDLPVACVQNGVHNERAAQHHFDHVYAVTVNCPTAFLEPGRVVAYSRPTTGILDVGRYPTGVDDTCRALATALRDATFVSEARADIMRWKYRKLVVNVGNAVEALCGPAARRGAVAWLAAEEAERVLDVAGIALVSRQEDAERRGDIIRQAAVDGAARPGGSMWQSLARGAGSIEADYINGEIVRLARAMGAVAPVNVTLQRLCTAMIAQGRPPASLTEREVLDRVRAASADI
jgi:2-dehydropantoate 2-reductase